MSLPFLAPLLLALILAVPAVAAERKPAPATTTQKNEAADPKALLASLEARLGEGEKLAARLRQGLDTVVNAANALQDLRGAAFLAPDHATLDRSIAQYDSRGLRAGLDDLADALRLPFWRTAELVVPVSLDKGYGKLAGVVARLDAALKPDPRGVAEAIPFKRVLALQNASEALLSPLFPLLAQTRGQATSLERAIQGWRRQVDSLRLATAPATAPTLLAPAEDKEAAKIRAAVEKEEQARKEKQP